MAVNFKITEDNTAPAYSITCKRDGVVIDLTTATSVVLIIQRKSDKVITQAGGSATVTSTTGGVISYAALASDFPSSGTYVADIKVTYVGGGVEILYNQAKWKVRTKIS